MSDNAKEAVGHDGLCISQHTEWSGSPADKDPDNFWTCDECGGLIPAVTELADKTGGGV